MTDVTGTILAEDGWIKGTLSHQDGLITRIAGDPGTDLQPPFIVPGFVDLHIHGGGGADMMEGEEAIRTTARLHARHGTTAFLVTTVTAPEADLTAVMHAVRAVMDRPEPGGARVLGVHLEGPFINPDKLGAQPPFARPADVEEYRRLAAIAPVRAMTLAPEMDPDGRLQLALAEDGVAVQIGHTLCTYVQGRAALAAGAGVTHLYNAMTGVAHRGNGAAGAALAHAEYAEIIPDLVHVEAGAVLAALRAIPGLYGVTDATAGAGMPDGPYRLGGREVMRKGASMVMPDGTLAGSCLTMDTALLNFLGLGLPLREAVERLSRIPAEWIGEKSSGCLRPGSSADILIFDSKMKIKRVLVSGKLVE